MQFLCHLPIAGRKPILGWFGLDEFQANLQAALYEQEQGASKEWKETTNVNDSRPDLDSPLKAGFVQNAETGDLAGIRKKVWRNLWQQFRLSKK